jgi:hypothetical protein
MLYLIGEASARSMASLRTDNIFVKTFNRYVSHITITNCYKVKSSVLHKCAVTLKILVMLCTLSFSVQVLAESTPSCLGHKQPQCLGPYVIRPARQSSYGRTCLADQWSVMTSCMQQCQEDMCCQAFGVDAAGKCVTSRTQTEELHFVKESEEAYPLRCKGRFIDVQKIHLSVCKALDISQN